MFVTCIALGYIIQPINGLSFVMLAIVEIFAIFFGIGCALCLYYDKNIDEIEQMMEKYKDDDK